MKTMKKKFNTQSITITVNAVQSLDKFDRGTDRRDTEFKHDALQLLLNSPNPLRKDYNFDGHNEEAIYDEIALLKKKMQELMREATYLLISTKKHDIDVIAEPRDEWQLHAESGGC
tara:strand:- start:678 stop:1025 length:348 start_codon:yes stop_codon:yes gene_type:complete